MSDSNKNDSDKGEFKPIAIKFIKDASLFVIALLLTWSVGRAVEMFGKNSTDILLFLIAKFIETALFLLSGMMIVFSAADVIAKRYQVDRNRFLWAVLLIAGVATILNALGVFGTFFSFQRAKGNPTPPGNEIHIGRTNN